MTYQEFVDYIIVHLWKQGDTVVIENLPTLMRLAETELDRKLREVPDREVIFEAVVDSDVYTLPTDCKRVRHVSSDCGGLTYVIPDHFSDLKRRMRNVLGVGEYFSSVNNQLLLMGNITPTSQVNLKVWYERKVPQFVDGGTSWLVDDFLDLYTYCVLKHSASFLREDERLTMWVNMYTDALASVIEEGADRKFTGSPMTQRFSPNIR